MSDDVAKIAKGLTEAQRRAILTPPAKVWRAGDLCPHDSHQAAQGWLRDAPFFARYYHGGYMAYRLTPLGAAVRAHLEADHASE